MSAGQFVINGNSNGPASTIENRFPEIKAGQTSTIILELDQSFKNDRDVRFEITTQKGGVFVYTIISGHQMGWVYKQNIGMQNYRW